jgi:MFS family permease
VNEDLLVRTKSTGLLLVLTAAMGIGPLVNYGLSTTSALIIKDFGIAEGQFGLLAAVCFFSAALSSFPLGRLSDRISSKGQLAIIFGGTSVGLLAIALASSYTWLLVAMAVAGPAQALSNPMTNRIIMDRVEPGKRASWIGVKQSGVQGSQLFAGLFFPAVALFAGWQGAAGAAAALAVGLMMWSWKRLEEESPQALPRWGKATRYVSTATDTDVAAWSHEQLGRGKRLPALVWVFAGYSLFSGAGLQATNVYLPLFAHRELDLGLLMAGLTAGLAGAVGVSSRIFWGRRMNAGARTSSLLSLLAAGSLLGTAFLLVAGEFHAQPLLWLGVLLHGATALGGNVVVMAGLMRSVPNGRIGTASGVVALGLYLGFALGPLIMGTLLQQSGGFFNGWAVVAASYVMCFLLSLLLRRHPPELGRARIPV